MDVRFEHALPHARGGVSLKEDGSDATLTSSPRPWGCFHLSFELDYAFGLFPTPVGVFLQELCALSQHPPLPHARGGVSRCFPRGLSYKSSSPRPWGCFQRLCPQSRQSALFPTPVGVFPTEDGKWLKKKSLPHARGGVSQKVFVHFPVSPSSPRPWGCFLQAGRGRNRRHVFPTPVGVFPPCRFLPAGGIGSSPRPWGCFQKGLHGRDESGVFPTPVGVFLFFGIKMRVR